jgi:diguanylate cyclase (GGDEF)-like protein/PAS domain S-box-containing protein
VAPNLVTGWRRFAPRREGRLSEMEQRFRRFAERAPVGMFETDRNGACTYVNRHWCELTGITPIEALAGGGYLALHADDRDRVADDWAEAMRLGHEFEGEFRIGRRDGTIVWVSGRAVPAHDPDGELTGYVGTVTDVSEQKREQLHYERLAYTDDLTGLANRRAAMVAMDRHLELSSQNGWLGALLLIDVDRLKDVNDRYGHDAGDRTLTGIADLMRASLGPGEVLGRLGGDEFVLLLPSADAKAATEAARSLLDALSSLGLSEPTASTTASIGVALVAPGTTRSDLLTRADRALYLVKDRGGANFAVYGSSMGPPDPIRN